MFTSKLFLTLKFLRISYYIMRTDQIKFLNQKNFYLEIWDHWIIFALTNFCGVASAILRYFINVKSLTFPFKFKFYWFYLFCFYLLCKVGEKAFVILITKFIHFWTSISKKKQLNSALLKLNLIFFYKIFFFAILS